MRRTIAFALMPAVLTVLAVILMHAPADCAQVSANLWGTVSDPSGAAVSGAAVTAKNVDTGLSRSSVTDPAGRYVFTALPVGSYELSAQKAGFAEEIRKGIHLVVGQDAGVDLTLHIGAVSEQLTVIGDAPPVSVTTQDISGLVGERQVKDLPLNGRSYDLLLRSIPASSTSPGRRPAAWEYPTPPPATILPSPATVRSRTCSC